MRFLLPALSLILSACLFSQEGDPGLPPVRFDYSRLDSLEHPLSRWYAISPGKSLVGMTFAFRSLAYRAEVDANVAAFAKEAGRKPALAGAYFDISSQGVNLRTVLEAVHAHGIVPYMTFDPKDFDNPDSNYQKTFLSMINRGEFDAKLKELAGVFREFGLPVMLRFAHEMNGDWYYYSGAKVGGGRDADGDGLADGPQNYIRAWRHVHDLFTAEGATKVVWIFCPNGESFPPADWNRPFRYYPGSAYVDMIASDSYEIPEKRRLGMDQVLSGFYAEMGRFWDAHEGDPEFPLRAYGLGEFGTSRPIAEEKSDWYGRALGYIASEGRIRFHVLYNGVNGGKDFTITGLGGLLQGAYAQDRFQFETTLLPVP